MFVRTIFVFGSNEAGIHGAGAAQHARLYHGAESGNGFGEQGKSFAIPTKDGSFNVLPLVEIQGYVDLFIKYAEEHSGLDFKVTQIGCGYAGYKPKDIAPMFVSAPSNCWFDEAWEPYLPGKKFWGTG